MDCEAILGSGNATTIILEQQISARKIDLAIMGTSALHGLERIVFDSVTGKLPGARLPARYSTVGPQAMYSEAALRSCGPVVFATDFHFVTIPIAIRFRGVLLAVDRIADALPACHAADAGGPCTKCRDVPAIMAEALHQLANDSGVVVQTPICATTFGSEVSCRWWWTTPGSRRRSSSSLWRTQGVAVRPPMRIFFIAYRILSRMRPARCGPWRSHRSRDGPIAKAPREALAAR